MFKGFCSGHRHNNAFIDFDGKPSNVLGGLIETLSPISFRLFKTIVAPPDERCFAARSGVLFFSDDGISGKKGSCWQPCYTKINTQTIRISPLFALHICSFC